ncbi:MAG: hypothetical protein HFJ53_03245 [Clostridia bacterium]|jgi:hypothetical protein|nr:hypothetical protein [Clostridia bacterium]
MRRITYLIDDKVGFEKLLKKKKPQLSEEELQKRLDDIKGFSAYYTLQENKSDMRYSLEDLNGKRININNLNGYENMYLNECFDCFIKKRKIPAEYKDFIKILDKPKEMNFGHNVRYEIFQCYAKKNNIKGTATEYINFVDNKYNGREDHTIKSMYESFYNYLETNTEKLDILKNALTPILPIEYINELDTEDIVEWALEEKAQLNISDKELQIRLNNLLDANMETNSNDCDNEEEEEM